MTATDANRSEVIDSLPALRSLLNSCIRETYRAKAKNPNFIKAIAVRKTIAMVSGVGTLPDEVMRQFLRQADWADINNSFISYFDYPVDSNSGQNFTQLAYVAVVGDAVNYTERAPGTSTSYTGNLFCTVPSFPVFPASMASEIPLVDEVVDDTVLLLAKAIRGEVKFNLEGSMIA